MLGREVRPRRAREAFWRWEQAWARRTRDMVVRTDGEEGDFGQRNGRVGVRRVVEVVEYLLVRGGGGGEDLGWTRIAGGLCLLALFRGGENGGGRS